MRRIKRSRHAQSIDITLLVLVVALLIFGLVALNSASAHLGERQFGDPYYYLKHQIVNGFSIGLITFLCGLLIPYHYYEQFAIPLLSATLILLILVLTPLGVTQGGASRWLSLGPITFQPAELLKISLIVYLAAWFTKNTDRRINFKKGFLPFLIIVGAMSILLLLQPATGTFVVLSGVAIAIYFASGAPLRYFGALIILGITGLALLIATTPYRLKRFTAFLNPDSDPFGTTYQLRQARISIGSGGIFGVGYGQSIGKINNLPEPIGDSIFAVIAEEFGFIGSMLLLFFFLALVMKIFMLAQKCDDSFGRLLLVGFGVLIGFQTFINIAAISGFIPLTGTPLPFISYGGTAFAVFMGITGILLNISRHTRS